MRPAALRRPRRAEFHQPAMRRMGILLLAWAALSGCGQPTAPAPAPKSSTTASSQANSAEKKPIPAAETQVAPPNETKSPPKESAPQASAPTAESVAAPEEQPSTSAATAPDSSVVSSNVPAVRIALLTDGGPTIVDLEIELDGRPLGASFDEILRHVRTSADADRDGTVAWRELTNQRQMRAGLLGHPALNDERAQLEFIRQHDANENGIVDEQEWPLVFREQSSRGRPFAIENRDDHRDWNRLHSPLLALLDADGDRLLSQAECRGAAARLMQLDADDDERIQTYEVSASQVEMPGMPARTQRRSSGPFFLWQIGPRTDWNQFIRACQIHYASGEPLAAGCFSARTQLFAQLDRDGNERLSLKEIAALTEIEPHLRLAVRWGGSRGDAASCSIRTWSDELGNRASNCRETARGVVLMQGASRVAMFDLNQAGPSPSARAAALLTQFDADKNAYLDGQEIEMASDAFGAPVDEVDANKDGQIKVEEIEAVLQLQANAAAEQVRAVASHPEDALWVYLDVDADGRLGGDEIAKAGQRIMELDHDQSGAVASDELPEAVWIAVARGEAPAGLIRPSASAAGPVEGVPSWFQQMDANGDGHLSRREFLGTDSLFQQLDADRDGKLTIDESSPKP